MTQPKRKKDEKADLVKLIQSVVPGDFVKVLENSIQRIVEEEVSMVLGADPYQRSEARTNYRNGSSPSQQGRLFMKKNLTWITKMKTMQVLAWPYIDCE